MIVGQLCYKCGKSVLGAIVGDDQCRYFKFKCSCGAGWTVLAPSVTPGGQSGPNEKKNGNKS